MTKCAVSRQEFKAAKAITVGVGGQDILASPRTFSTGSFGWHVNGKAMIDVGGVAVAVQVSGSITVIGSKELA